MAIWDAWLAPKEVKKCRQALQAGDYELAVELSRHEKVTESLRLEAARKHAIWHALHPLKDPPEDPGILATIARAAVLPQTVQKLPALERAMVELACMGMALENGDLQKALELGKGIADKEIRCQALRKLACHCAAGGGDLKETLSLFQAMPNNVYADEERRNLFLSLVMAKAFDRADPLFENLPQQFRAQLRKHFEFAKKYHASLAVAQEQAWSLGHQDDRAVALALVAGMNADYEKMAEITQALPEPIAVGSMQTFANALALAGQSAAALSLLQSIRRHPEAYALSLGHIAFNFPLEKGLKARIQKQMRSAEPTPAAVTYWQYVILEAMLAGDVEEGCALLNRIRHRPLKTGVARLLTDELYVLQSVAT